jgi:hypothetical protein
MIPFAHAAFLIFHPLKTNFVSQKQKIFKKSAYLFLRNKLLFPIPVIILLMTAPTWQTTERGLSSTRSALPCNPRVIYVTRPPSPTERGSVTRSNVTCNHRVTHDTRAMGPQIILIARPGLAFGPQPFCSVTHPWWPPAKTITPCILHNLTSFYIILHVLKRKGGSRHTDQKEIVQIVLNFLMLSPVGADACRANLSRRSQTETEAKRRRVRRLKLKPAPQAQTDRGLSPIRSALLAAYV